MNGILFIYFLSFLSTVFTNDLINNNNNYYYSQELQENGYIVNGETVIDIDEIPFQVAILRKHSFGHFEYICSGSIIGNRTVLSAAHCFYGFDRQPNLFIVRYGTLDHRIGPTINVIRIILYPSFRRYLYDMDLAIVLLSSTLEHSRLTKVISANDKAPSPGTFIQISGWGKLGSNEPISNQLQKVHLQVLPQTVCKDNWKDNVINDNMFCARGMGKSACKGDSGGPAIQDGKLVGVVSWGSPVCLHPSFPNVFVQISMLYDWIQLNII